MARWTIHLAIVVVLAATFCLTLKPQPHTPKVVYAAYCTLQANDQDVMFFRTMTSDSLFKGCSLSYHAENCRAVIADSFLSETPSVRNLHRILRKNKTEWERQLSTIKELISETDYYLHVHHIQDDGYDRVEARRLNLKDQQSAVCKLIATADSLLRMPPHVLSLKRIVKRCPDSAIACDDVFYSTPVGVWNRGYCMKIPKNGRGLSIDASGRIICGEWSADSLMYGRRYQNEGIYEGEFGYGEAAVGHGTFTYNDGRFYEGSWMNDTRHGFGFESDTVHLKLGEWKNNRFLGEKLKYTQERIYGIDISRYQHGHGRKFYPIHWNRLRIIHLGKTGNKGVVGTCSYPVSFVFIKSTEGTTIRNRHYQADYKQARRHGIPCGAYHFFSTKSSGAAQARHFLRYSKFSSGDFPPVLDIEPTDARIRAMGGKDALFKEIRSWLHIVEKQTGVKPILYVSQSFVNKYLREEANVKRNYDVWIARYGEYKPDVRLVFWQLTANGRVDGITGAVDINVFNGYKSQFDAFKEHKTIR